jgi:hypothetical protein
VLEAKSLEDTLSALGEVLGSRGLSFDLVAIGGSGMLLLGLIQRPTRDLDVVAMVEHGIYRSARPLPHELSEAVRDVGESLDIGTEWLYPGPTDLLTFGLPAGFAERTVIKTYGPLTIRVASRLDQVHFKLYAAADGVLGDRHDQDLHALQPTRDELLAAARWAMTHDPSDGFRSMLVPVLLTFGVDDAADVL